MKSKNKRKRTVFVIILILIILIILFLIRINILREIIVRAENPDEKVVSVGSSELKQSFCNELDFNWTYAWDGWEDVGVYFISPVYRLYNLEDRAGFFSVRFGFFDEETYPFVRYEGKDYDVVRDELPWSAASMLSDNLTFLLKPLESRRVVIPTKRADVARAYWVYADVNVPVYTRCDYTYETVNGTRNITIKDTKTKSYVYYKNESVTLLEYLFYLLAPREVTS